MPKKNQSQSKLSVKKIFAIIFKKIISICWFLLRFLIGTIKLVAWLIGIIFVIIIITQIYWYWYYTRQCMGSAKFDSTIWKALKNPSCEKYGIISKKYDGIACGSITQCNMYNDLTKNYLKKGMKVTEVENLLGRPISYSYCLEKKVKCATYVLGQCWSAPWSVRENFIICFNGGNELTTFDRTHAEYLSLFGLKFAERIRLIDKICDYKLMHCSILRDKCDCYMKKGDYMGQECSHKTNKW